MLKSTRCLSFYKVLKKDKSFGWDEKYKKAFIQLKECLSSPPILTKPEMEETFFLYIVASKETIKTMLIIKKKNGEQRPVYYTSKDLHNAKVRYQKIKKLAYVVILASRRLKSYF